MSDLKGRIKSFGTPIVPEAEKERIMKEINILKTTDENHPDWKLVGTYSGFKCYKPAETPKEFKIISSYADGVLDCSVKVAHEFFSDLTKAKDLDDNIDTITVLDDGDKHNKVLHVKMKSLYYTTARDAVVQDHWQVDNDGNLYSVRYSTEHADAPADQDMSKAIRSWTTGGAVLTPIPGEETKCRVKIVRHVDPRTELVPKWILRSFGSIAHTIIAKEAGAKVKVINKMLKKEQRKRMGDPALMVNHDGEYHPENGEEVNTKAQVVVEDPFLSDKSRMMVDLLIGLIVVGSYVGALAIHN